MPRLVPLLALSIACAGPPLDGAAVVLLEPRAADAGVMLRLDEDPSQPLLPRLVDASLPLSVLGPTEDVDLALAPATALVLGVDAEDRLTTTTLDIGDDVSDQALRVRASQEAALDLADQIGAEIAGEARGRWLLVGGDALLLASIADEAPGIRGASLVPTEENLPEPMLEAAGLVATVSTPGLSTSTRGGQQHGHGAWVGPESARWVDRATDNRGGQVERIRDALALDGDPGLELALNTLSAGDGERAPWVGLYCGEGQRLLLDGEGGWASGSALDLTVGQWQVDGSTLTLQTWGGMQTSLRMIGPGKLYDDVLLTTAACASSEREPDAPRSAFGLLEIR